MIVASDPPARYLAAPNARIPATCAGIAAFILNTADYDRTDRLWPASQLVFATNPLSIAYGAGGIALSLARCGYQVPKPAKEWIGSREVTVGRYPPGAFTGLAGIAYALAEIGLAEQGEEILQKCYSSPLRFRDATMFHGAAGWGLVSLYFAVQTGNATYLERAAEAAEYLVRSAAQSDDGMSWVSSADGAINYGYGYGASGVAYFLLLAAEALQRPHYLAAARAALDFDVAHREITPNGWGWPARDSGTASRVTLPYWGHGAAGVGTTAIRFYNVLGEERYRELAETIADGCACKWTVFPSLVDGLAGIGDFMIDMYLATDCTEYYERARDIADTILWYGVERPQGIGFPGRSMTRLSNDFATGAAGILTYLHRLTTLGARPLVDLVPYTAKKCSEPRGVRTTAVLSTRG